MSLDSCRPLSSLSLSLTSLLSRPVFIQGSSVGSPDSHSHWRVGRGFNGGGLSRREGRFSLYLFVEGLSKREGRFQRYLFSEVFSAMRAGGGTGRAASFGWRAPCPGHTHLGSSARRTSPGLRQDQRGPVRCRQIPDSKPAEFHGGARRTVSSAWTILSH